jgi:integrase
LYWYPATTALAEVIVPHGATHDLRHTVGMRLREGGVVETTISDILWHKKKTTTQHYSVAQVVELHAALEKIKDDNGQWNKSLATLKREQIEARSAANPPKVPQQEKSQK